MIKIFMLSNLIALYTIVGIANGYNIAYRIVTKRKQSKKECFLAFVTIIVSLPVFIISIVSLLAFYRKRKVERRKRQGSVA